MSEGSIRLVSQGYDKDGIETFVPETVREASHEPNLQLGSKEAAISSGFKTGFTAGLFFTLFAT